MEPGTPLICLFERRSERFPLFLDVQMKSAELNGLMRKLHTAVVTLDMSSTTKLIVSMSEQPDVSGDFKVRIHSPELIVDKDEISAYSPQAEGVARRQRTSESYSGEGLETTHRIQSWSGERSGNMM